MLSSSIESFNIIPELTLEQKIAHAHDPIVRLALARQLIEETKADLFVNADKWENEVNSEIPLLLGSLKISPIHYKCRVFFHVSDDKRWIVSSGTIVEIHYYGHGLDKDRAEFKAGLKNALQNVPKLQRSNALELRNVILTRKSAMAATWQRIKKGDREIIFNLLKRSEYKLESKIEITVRMVHKESGISMTVVGNEHDRVALENQCLVLLSRKVAETFGELDE